MLGSRLLRSKVVWGGAAVIGGIITLERLLPNHELIEVLRVLNFATALAVVVAYWREALYAAASPEGPDRVGQLALGITIGWMASSAQGLWNLIWRLAGKPHWMQESVVQTVIIVCLIGAALLHITAPGAINGVIPSRSKVLLGISVGIAAMISGMLVLSQPDLSYVTDWLAPIIAPPEEEICFPHDNGRAKNRC